MLSKVAGTALLFALAGCASPSAPAPTSAAAAKEAQRAKAVAQAKEYCRKKGLVMRAGPADAPTRQGQASPELQFRCVKAKPS